MSEAAVMIVRAVPKPGQTQAVLDVLTEVLPMIHDEEGCELYALHVHENGDIYFIEKWSSAALAEQHGRSSAVIPILQERTTPLLEGLPEIIAVTPVVVSGAKGAL